MMRIISVLILTSNCVSMGWTTTHCRTRMTMNVDSNMFEQPITIPQTVQRRMLKRGVAIATSLAVASTSASISSSATNDEIAQSGVSLCSSCGKGSVQGSISSLCYSCAQGDQWYNPKNERIFDTMRGSYLPPKPEIFLSKDRLDGRKIVAIGEVHSNPCHHKLEFDIIRTLANGGVDGSKLGAIALECFYRQHQGALDSFIFDHKNVAILKRETDWDKNWGYDLNYYAKIFQFAAVNNIRLVGLNVPYQVASLVGRYGLDNLPAELRRLLPPVDLTVQKHRQQFEDAILASGGSGTGAHGGMSAQSDAFDRMYQVQTLWDEYMAESAAMHVKKNPQDTLVVIAGVGHVAGRVGIPDRIHRRLGDSKVYGRMGGNPFVVVPSGVNWNSESGLPDVVLPPSADDCDWTWFTEKEIYT